MQLIEERSFEYSWSNRLLRVNKETESKKHWQFHSCDFTFFLSQCRTLYSNKKHLTCCTFAQEVGSGKPSNLTLQSDCVGQFKTTRGKMKSDTDSQERQQTIISHSTVECMPPSLPPPQKKKLWSFIFKTEIDLLCWTCHAQVIFT